jgi:hypothetical protein
MEVATPRRMSSSGFKNKKRKKRRRRTGLVPRIVLATACGAVIPACSTQPGSSLAGADAQIDGGLDAFGGVDVSAARDVWNSYDAGIDGGLDAFDGVDVSAARDAWSPDSGEAIGRGAEPVDADKMAKARTRKPRTERYRA